jgi:hypothetical protein
LSGVELREADEAHAEGLVVDELRRRRWKESEFGERRKGDEEKVEIAARLRRETTMTLKWIAKRLNMGTWTHVSNCLVRKRKQNEKCQQLWGKFFSTTFLFSRKRGIGRVAVGLRGRFENSVRHGFHRSGV